MSRKPALVLTTAITLLVAISAAPTGALARFGGPMGGPMGGGSIGFAHPNFGGNPGGMNRGFSPVAPIAQFERGLGNPGGGGLPVVTLRNCWTHIYNSGIRKGHDAALARAEASLICG
jgi:hypothetical protein